MCPGVTAGAHAPVSCVFTILRSPSVNAVMSSFSAERPLWASLVRVHANVFVP